MNQSVGNLVPGSVDIAGLGKDNGSGSIIDERGKEVAVIDYTTGEVTRGPWNVHSFARVKPIGLITRLRMALRILRCRSTKELHAWTLFDRFDISISRKVEVVRKILPGERCADHMDWAMGYAKENGLTYLGMSAVEYDDRGRSC